MRKLACMDEIELICSGDNDVPRTCSVSVWPTDILAVGPASISLV